MITGKGTENNQFCTLTKRQRETVFLTLATISKREGSVYMITVNNDGNGLVR